MKDLGENSGNSGKFQDPLVTADGVPRASVALSHAETLWFNTGTLCNITCANCYIDSSPTNDSLVYLTADEVSDYLDQIEARDWRQLMRLTGALILPCLNDVKVLVSITDQRIPIIPDTPTIGELDPSLNIALWNGLFVTKDTPQDVRDKIIAVAKETAFSPRCWASSS